MCGEVGLRLPDEIVRLAEPASTAGALEDEGMEGVESSEAKPFEPAGGGEGGGGLVPEKDGIGELSDEVLMKLHKLLLETQVQEGVLVCGRCGHRYPVKEGIPNFLLPPHLVA